MAEYKPQSADQHFAQQRATRAAEYASAASEAQQKSSEESRNRNERFYNNLALFSSGTVALSVTYLGYLKNLPRPIQHPRWLIASWISLMTCAACSLFWSFVYGCYSHYFHERQTAEALKEKFETEAKEYPTLARGTVSVQTRALVSQKEIESYISNRMEASAKCEKTAADAKRRENFHMHFWRWLGRIAQASFLSGLAVLLAFATRNI
jgi:hypothetical protein